MSTWIFRGATFLGIQQLIAILTTVVVQVVLGRTLGPQGYGQFALFHAALSLVLFTFLIGVPQTVALFTAEDAGRASTALRKGLLLQAWASLAIGGILYIASDPLAEFLNATELAALLRVGALSIPLTALAYVFIYSLNGARRFGRQGIALGSLSTFKFAGILIAIATAGASARSAAIGIVGGAVPALIVAAYLVRGIPKRGEYVPTGLLLRISLQFTALFLFSAIWDEISILMFGTLADYSEDIGFLNAALTITNVFDALSLPLLLALFPLISSAVAVEAREELERHFRNAIGLAFVFFAPFAAGAFIVGDDVLAIFFGREYIGAGFIVGPLTIAAIFSILYAIVDTYLRGSRRLRMSAVIVAFLLSAQIVLNFILIPHFQLWGVAISILSVSTLAGTGMVVYAIRALGLRIRWTLVLKVALATGVAFLPLFMWEPDQSQYALLLAAVCLGIYAGLLILLGEGKRSEIASILDKVRRLT